MRRLLRDHLPLLATITMIATVALLLAFNPFRTVPSVPAPNAAGSPCAFGTFLGSRPAYTSPETLGSVELCDVQGLLLQPKAARAADGLLNKGRVEMGFILTGNGYRSPDQVRDLRRKNGCIDPERNFDPHTGELLPCVVAASALGTGRHEHGLSVDFYYDGRFVQQGTPVYAWLSEHGPRFGWKQTLPQEPWHWEYVG